MGELSVFIRLQGCSAKYACYEIGVRCDTEFESGQEMSLDALIQAATDIAGPCRWIVWTGGEPLDQLTSEEVQAFKTLGWKQAIETSGVRPFPREFRLLFDWIACSPKVAEHVLVKHFGDAGIMVHHPARVQPEATYAEEVAAHVHELRYVRHAGQSVPVPSLTALTYYLSPLNDGMAINYTNLKHVIELVRLEPRWRVSAQAHKVWGVL